MMLILNLFDSSGIRGSVEPPFLLHRVSLQCLPWWCSSLESFSLCLLPASDSLTLLSLVRSTVDYILFFFSWYIYSLTWLYPKKECVGSKLPFTLEMYCLVNSCIALDSQLSLSYFLGILLQSLMHFGSVPLQTEVFPSPFWNLFRSFLIFLGVLNFAMAGLRVCVFVCMYRARQQLPKSLPKAEGGEEIPWLPPSSALVSCQRPHWPAQPGSKESYPGI